MAIFILNNLSYNQQLGISISLTKIVLRVTEFGHVQCQGATGDHRHQIVARFQSRFRENSVYQMTAAKSHATLKQPAIERVMHAPEKFARRIINHATSRDRTSIAVSASKIKVRLSDRSWATSDVSGSTSIFPDVRAESVESQRTRIVAPMRICEMN